ncbi:MAG: hypothetical protein ACRD0O_06165, partial [Acidimicrobiia bacterium]
MRRLRVLVVALALVAGACSGDGDDSQDATEAPPHTAGTTTTTIAVTTTANTAPSTTTQKAVTPAPSVTAPPTTARQVTLEDVKVRLTQVVNLGSGFGPLALAQRPGDDTLYVAGQRGRVAAVRNGV